MSSSPTPEVRIAGLDDALADSASLRRRGWFVTITLMLFMLVNFADKSVVGIVGVELQHDLGISSAQYGLLQSVFFWPFAVGALVLGALGGRVSARWLLTGLVALWVVSLIPLTGIFTASFAILVAARMLLGFAEGPAAALAQQITHTGVGVEGTVGRRDLGDAEPAQPGEHDLPVPRVPRHVRVQLGARLVGEGGDRRVLAGSSRSAVPCRPPW